MNRETTTAGTTPVCYRCGQALDAFGRCTNSRWACAGGSKEGWATLPDGNYVKSSVYEDIYEQLCAAEVRKRTMVEVQLELAEKERDKARRDLAEAEEAILKLWDIASFFHCETPGELSEFYDQDYERGVPGHWSIEVDPKENGGYKRMDATHAAQLVANHPAVRRALERKP